MNKRKLRYQISKYVSVCDNILLLLKGKVNGGEGPNLELAN